MRRWPIAVFFGILISMSFVQAEEVPREICIQNGEGTTYQVYEDPDCHIPYKEIILDENGKAVIHFDKDTYWKQSKPKKGYYGDPSILHITPENAGDQYICLQEPIVAEVEAYQNEEPVLPHYQVLNAEGKMIYDSETEANLLLEVNETYTFHEVIDEEWQGSENRIVTIPLYKDPDASLQVVFRHQPYGNLLIKTDHTDVETTLSLFEDEAFTKTAKDIYGNDAVSRAKEGAVCFSMPKGEYYCRKETGPQFYDEDKAEPYSVSLFATQEEEETLDPVECFFSVMDSLQKIPVEPIEISIRQEKTEKTETIHKDTPIPLEKDKTYVISCKSCPKGYFPFSDITFTTDHMKPNETPVLEAECIPFRVHILVKDADTGDIIPDVHLRLNDSVLWNNHDSDIPLHNGSEVLFSKDESFSITVENIKDPLYLFPDKKEFTVSSAATDLYYEIPCRSFGRIRVSCMQAEKKLENIGYQLYEDAECTKPAKGIDGKNLKGKSDKNGNISFAVANGTYYGKVTGTPDIYKNQTEIKQLQVYHQEINVIQNFEKNACIFEAWDRDNNRKIENIRFLIKDENGQTTEFDLSSKEKDQILYGLHRNMNYTVSVQKAPEGYLPVYTEQSFTMTDLCTVRYEFDPYFQVLIHVSDDTGEKAADATVAFYTDPECKVPALDENGKEAYGNDSVMLPKGTYYAKLKDIPIRFFLDNNIREIRLPEDEEIVFQLKPVKYAFAAVNQRTGKTISSARFRIMDEKGNFVNEGTEGILLERDRTYFLSQTEIQGRFIPVNNPMKFTTPEKKPDHDRIILIENQPYVSVVFREKEGDAGIADIECSLYLDEGCTQKAYDILGDPLQNTTDQNGSVYWRLFAGQYWLKESFEKKGYYLSEPLCITINPAEGDSQMFEREHMRTCFYVRTTDEQQNPLGGAVIEIKKDDGTVLQTFTSHHEPERIEGDMLLPHQKYVVHVKNVPDGYEKEIADFVIELPEQKPSSIPEVQVIVKKKPASIFTEQNETPIPQEKESMSFPILYAGIGSGIAGIGIMTALFLLKKKRQEKEIL